MTVISGAPAPSFSTVDLFGRPVSLAAYRGTPLLLSFFRNAACALCNLRVRSLIERYPTLQAEGLRIVAVFESPGEALREHVGKQDAPFPIVADPHAELFDLYGVESSQEKVDITMNMPATGTLIEEAARNGFELVQEEGSNFSRMPADFFIGADGVVLKAHYADFVWDHMPLETIEALLGVTAAA